MFRRLKNVIQAATPIAYLTKTGYQQHNSKVFLKRVNLLDRYCVIEKQRQVYNCI
jgi:hypothetical protein